MGRRKSLEIEHVVIVFIVVIVIIVVIVVSASAVKLLHLLYLYRFVWARPLNLALGRFLRAFWCTKTSLQTTHLSYTYSERLYSQWVSVRENRPVETEGKTFLLRYPFWIRIAQTATACSIEISPVIRRCSWRTCATLSARSRNETKLIMISGLLLWVTISETRVLSPRQNWFAAWLQCSLWGVFIEASC